MKKNIAISIILSLLMLIPLLGCASNGEITPEQKLAAESIIVRAAARNACLRHPEAIPAIRQICADAAGQSGDILAGIIRKAIEDHAADLSSDPYLKEDLKDLAELIGIPMKETIPGVALQLDNEKIEKLFAAACQGAEQAGMPI